MKDENGESISFTRLCIKNQQEILRLQKAVCLQKIDKVLNLQRKAQSFWDGEAKHRLWSLVSGIMDFWIGLSIYLGCSYLLLKVAKLVYGFVFGIV